MFERSQHVDGFSGFERRRLERREGGEERPPEWDDADLLTFEQFCNLIQTAPRTVRDWRRRRVGPRWVKLEGCSRLLVTVGEVRRFLGAAIAEAQAASPPQPERRPA